MNLEQIADKTDITVANLSSNGGYLTTEQESAFIRKLTDYPTILTNTRKVVMSGPKREINKIGFGGRILRKAPTSAVPMLAAQRSAPSSSTITL